jgi:5-methyltetrahydrofolate--homocysteine methyltransferase
LNIGERTNVTGSRKFLRLIKEEKIRRSTEHCKEQVEGGANHRYYMDEGMLDEICHDKIPEFNCC